MACIQRTCYCKVVSKPFCRSHSFSCQSLLLGTNVPNDKPYNYVDFTYASLTVLMNDLNIKGM